MSAAQASQTQLAPYPSPFESIQQALANFQREIQSKRLESEEISRQDAAKTEKLEKLKSDVGKLTTEKAELESDVEELTYQKAELKSNNEELTYEKAELKSDVEELTTEKAELKSDTEELTYQKAELKSDIEELTTEKAELQAEVQDERTKRDDAQKKGEEIADRVMSLSSQQRLLEKKVSLLRQDVNKEEDRRKRVATVNTEDLQQIVGNDYYRLSGSKRRRVEDGAVSGSTATASTEILASWPATNTSGLFLPNPALTIGRTGVEAQKVPHLKSDQEYEDDLRAFMARTNWWERYPSEMNVQTIYCRIVDDTSQWTAGQPPPTRDVPIYEYFPNARTNPVVQAIVHGLKYWDGSATIRATAGRKSHLIYQRERELKIWHVDGRGACLRSILVAAWSTRANVNSVQGGRACEGCLKHNLACFVRPCEDTAKIVMLRSGNSSCEDPFELGYWVRNPEAYKRYLDLHNNSDED